MYFDAASYGLAPRSTARAMHRAIDAWQSGEADWIADWDRAGESARVAFAGLLGATADDVALLPASSVGVAVAATALRSGDEVVVPLDEFTSVLFPILVAARDRGVTVREVPYAQLVDAVTETTRLVAFSLVRSQTGDLAPLREICDSAARAGAGVLVDATHALPFTDLREVIGSIDYLVCSAYKHLLCPRGAAFLYVRRDRRDALSPLHANWRAADSPYTRFFGGGLTLAAGAARFDVSLAWLSWVGAVESMRLILRWRNDGTLASVPLLAADLARQLGTEPSRSTLVCVRVSDLDAARAALHDRSIKASVRGDAIRFSPHVYNTAEEIGRVAEVISPLVVR